MSKEDKKNKETIIREMLLKTVGKSPALFSYYASILEAKELLKNTGDTKIKKVVCSQDKQINKLIAEV